MGLPTIGKSNLSNVIVNATVVGTILNSPDLVDS
ncbi:iron ABC transporter substrate-binding protein [Staphylococcus aureus]|nr:putative iron compound ABC transporter, iron compound-binding protein [Staphylococcus aureus subsp. aureus 091751]EOR40245.1 putative iron compound ABC transporter, iron compound-binding protein [Staphylococcus aureus subsp. aureus MRGR3]EOR47292.1 putative iron compound ABC transporter, iron compound-binding protein [Staphylococcus aureus subsp. aureus 112808A]PNK81975.1 iron ABC transporter substrate-binding protein [Staphylococcus aureus]